MFVRVSENKIRCKVIVEEIDKGVGVYCSSYAAICLEGDSIVAWRKSLKCTRPVYVFQKRGNYSQKKGIMRWVF